MDNYFLLIQQRNEYEDLLYDLLIGQNNFENNFENNFVIEQFIPESFWEPVNVSLTIEQIESLKSVVLETKQECFICNESKHDFKNLGCCNNNMCQECIINWFNISVYCPFCKRDQR